MNVRMPDGTLVRGVPEGTTKAQLAAKFAARGDAAQSAAEEFSPTADMSTFDRVAAGAGKALVDTGRGVAGLFGADNGAEVAESRRLDEALLNTPAGLTGNIAGNVGLFLTPGGALKGGAIALNALKAAPRVRQALTIAGSRALNPTTVKGATGLGLGFGAIQPAVDQSERAINALTGAAAGGAGQGAFNSLARVIRPNTSKAARAVLRSGVDPTPGQILGGGFQKAEDAVAGTPFVGDFVNSARERATEQFNRVAINRALKPIGEKLPKDLIGHDAIAFAGDTLGDNYNNLLPKMQAQLDPIFAEQIANLQNMVVKGAIDPKASRAFTRILNDDVLGKFQGQGSVTGETLKGIMGDVSEHVQRFSGSSDVDQRAVSNAFKETERLLRDLVTRENPKFARELASINKGFANFKRVQKAAGLIGAEDGIFSAAQLHRAVRAADRSKDKGKFASGRALMQDLSGSAKSVLGSKVPDSGTPRRLLTAAALGAGGTAALTGDINPAAATALLAAPVLFSPIGQKVLANALGRRPQSFNALARGARSIAPVAAIGGIVGSQQQ